MATGRRLPEDDTDIEIKVCQAIVTPHPSLAIVRFWQGAVEILLRVTCMVRKYLAIGVMNEKCILRDIARLLSLKINDVEASRSLAGVVTV